MNYEIQLRITNYEIQLRITNYELRVMYGLQILILKTFGLQIRMDGTHNS